MHEYFVYMLKCEDGSYYTGVTNDYKRRVAEHERGAHESCYTFSRRPVRLVYVTEFKYILDAIAWEKRIKRWSRNKKRALIQQDQEALEHFSKRRSGRPHYAYNDPD